MVNVLIVGAGSMGTIIGYDLSRANANVTFLVRPHRSQQLSRPQLLYSYDDQTLKEFKDFKVLTDPSQINSNAFEYIYLTMDGNALRSEQSRNLIDSVGKAAKGTSTIVFLGGVGIDLRNWVIERTGLQPSQVSFCMTTALIYEAQKTKLTVHEGVKSDLLAKADYGFKNLSTDGITLDTSSETAAHAFAKVYDANGTLKARIVSAAQFRSAVPSLVTLVGLELIDWPAMKDVQASNEGWQLAVNATKEFQGLPTFGAEANQAAKEMTSESLLARWQMIEKLSLPLDLADFNRYHHGGKVSAQDHEVAREALELAQKEKIDAPALRELVAKLDKKDGKH